MVTMNFPVVVQIYDENYELQKFGPGVVDVPDELSTHWYFAANGATIVPVAAAPKLSKKEQAAIDAAAVAVDATAVDAPVATA